MQVNTAEFVEGLTPEFFAALGWYAHYKWVSDHEWAGFSTYDPPAWADRAIIQVIRKQRQERRIAVTKAIAEAMSKPEWQDELRGEINRRHSGRR